MTHICFIVGENKSGKTYLQESLLASSKKLARLISFTSREKRPGEKEGVHYYFRSHEAIRSLIEKKQTLQHVEFGGNLYCTTLKQYKTKKTLLFVCTPEGIVDTIGQLKNSGDPDLVDAKFSIIYCMASKSLLNARGSDERSQRGNITEDFMNAYNAGIYTQIPIKILSDSYLNSDSHKNNLKELKEFLKQAK